MTMFKLKLAGSAGVAHGYGMNRVWRMVLLVAFILALYCFPPTAPARDIYVSLNGANSYPFTNWSMAATNIQWAVNAGSNDDTIWISNGIYYLTNQITVTSNLYICGTGGTAVINGNNAYRCFYCSAGATATLARLVITRGYTINNGGGVYLTAVGSMLRDCIVSENFASSNGGGVFVENGTVRDCLIRNNVAQRGGGICRSNISVVSSCTIVSNYANGAGEGGGVFDATLNITSYWDNCIIYYNASAAAYSNYYFGAYTSRYVTNCCFAPELTGSLTNLARNNITNEPLFIDRPAGNFRLSSVSPCINAGTNQSWMTGAKDLDDYNRIQWSVDIGCYEFRASAITVTPAIVTNFLIQGNKVSIPYTIYSTNYDMYWTARITSSWVSASCTNGSIPYNSSATVYLTNSSSTMTGRYTSLVRFFSTNYPNYGQTNSTVTMLLNVMSLTVSQSNMTNTVLSGGDATNLMFTILSRGYGNCSYSVTTNNAVDWLVVSNGAGSFTNVFTNTICLSFVSSNLTSGLRTGELDLATSDGGGWTQRVNVVLNVIGLAFSPPSLTNYVLYGFNAATQTFGVNAGGGALSYNASTSADWISVSPQSGYVSGSTTNTLTNTYATASLSVGDHAGEVLISSGDGGGTTNSLGITMRILATPLMAANPSVIRQNVDMGGNPTGDFFEVYNGSALPAISLAYNVAITNDTNSILQGISPGSGITTGQHDSINISYRNLSSFEAGTYTASVAVVGTNYGSGYAGHWTGTGNVQIILVVAAPDAPSRITATKGTYEDKVAVNWPRVITPRGGTVTYNILRHTTFDINYAQTIVSGLTTTNYNDETAAQGVRYYYWLKSVNAYGQAGTGSVYDTGYRRLPPPSGLFASDGTYTDRVVVTWASVDGASSYYVYRGNGGVTSLVFYTADTIFNDSQVSDGIEYVYSVQSSNSVCGSVLSVGESGYVLSRPYNVSASDGLYVGKVVLTWDAVGGATAYEVWRSQQTLTPPLGGGTKIAELASATYDDTAITAGTRYYYWVRSKNATTISPYSSREQGFSALAAVDLSVWGLVVQPHRIAPGGHPGIVSYRLANNGGGALSGDNGTVRLTFYSSTNPVFNESEAEMIGMVDTSVVMPVGARGVNRVLPDVVSLPTEPNAYYVFMKLVTAWPSTLAPANASGWYTRTANMIDVSSLGTINYQSMNDYDGDGMSDLAVHGSGLWSGRTLDGFELARGTAFGGSGVAVMGDYDSDRKTDVVVYDEARGYWQALMSNSGYTPVAGWFGGPGYMAVPGDYNGDGQTELAVYDTVHSLWYALKVGGGKVMWQVQFGGYGYAPVLGDYDGDGIWDLAVYSEETGQWYIRSPSGTLILSGDYWGSPGFRAVSGDYNGDGIWDLAVYDEATGRWYIKTVNGEMIVLGLLWGAPGYLPVSGDYDADSISDLAVYNSTTGKWFIRTVGGSYLLLDAAWGGNGQQAVGGVE
jgi:hypothetical protein